VLLQAQPQEARYPGAGSELSEEPAVELTLERPGDHLFIKAISNGRIQVGDEWHTGPLIMSANSLVTDWEVQFVADLSAGTLDLIFEFGPELVLLGTGARQQFPPAELMMEFYRRGVGAEVMSTAAACRTFNVLVSEQRLVVAALMPIMPG
jgi:uncharacterized protein